MNIGQRYFMMGAIWFIATIINCIVMISNFNIIATVVSAILFGAGILFTLAIMYTLSVDASKNIKRFDGIDDLK